MPDCFSLPNAAELVDETRLSAEYIARLNGGEAKDYIPWKAADALEQAVKQNAGMVKRCDELIAENTKLKAERNAAVADLREVLASSDGIVNDCLYCKYREDDGQCHHSCMFYSSEWGWEWRGAHHD